MSRNHNNKVLIVLSVYILMASILLWFCFRLFDIYLCTLRVLIFEISIHCIVISSPQCYRHAELEKKRKYQELICKVEHGASFPCLGPLATG